MRLRLTLILLLFSFLYVHSKESVEHESVFKIKYGFIQQLDSYLSPLAYSGQQIGLGNEWWQDFTSKDSTSNWSHVGRIHASCLITYNTAHSNSIYAFGMLGGWGAYYHWQWFNNQLKLFLGPYVEGNFMTRKIETNVNKPFSLDVSMDVMAMTGISWSFYGKKTSYRVRYLLRTNLIGFDYLPEYWQSYYEIAKGVSGITRLSAPWNHNVIRHEITMDFQFPHSTWRLGAEHAFLRYGTKNMHFTQNQINIIIGCIWKYKLKTAEKL